MIHDPFLKGDSLQIAGEYLRRSGEISNDAAADWLLCDSLDFPMRQGIRNPARAVEPRDIYLSARGPIQGRQ